MAVKMASCLFWSLLVALACVTSVSSAPIGFPPSTTSADDTAAPEGKIASSVLAAPVFFIPASEAVASDTTVPPSFTRQLQINLKNPALGQYYPDLVFDLTQGHEVPADDSANVPNVISQAAEDPAPFTEQSKHPMPIEISSTEQPFQFETRMPIDVSTTAQSLQFETTVPMDVSGTAQPLQFETTMPADASSMPIDVSSTVQPSQLKTNVPTETPSPPIYLFVFYNDTRSVTTTKEKWQRGVICHILGALLYLLPILFWLSHFVINSGSKNALILTPNQPGLKSKKIAF